MAAERAFAAEAEKLRDHQHVDFRADGVIVIDHWCDGDEAAAEKVGADTAAFRRAMSRASAATAELLANYGARGAA